MSRIGKKPIPLPAGVTVRVEGEVSTVKGPKGELRQHVPSGLGYELKDGQLLVTRPDDSKPMKARHGLTRQLIANQVKGVSEGFTRALEIEGVGYRAQVKGKILDLQLQFSHPVEYAIPPDVNIVTPAPNRIEVSGLDKQRVGQVAAEIRAFRKPEPYKGKGIRYAGEVIRKKAGKAAGK